MRLAPEDAEQAVFGTLDGLASALGLVVSVAASGRLQAVAVLATGCAVSMGLGEWLSDANGRVRRAVVMAVATAAGVVLPAVPLLVLGAGLARVACALIVVALGCVIAELRSGPALRSYLQTFAVIGVCLGLALLVGAAA